MTERPTPSSRQRFTKRTVGDGWMQRGLRQIYRGSGRRVSDLRTFERATRHRLRNGILIGLAVLAVAVLAGVWVFTGGGKFSQNITFTVTAPTDVASGDEVSYVFTIENTDDVDYAGVELTVRMPDAFTYLSADPETSNDFHNAWDLDRLRAGERQTVTLTGVILGDVGSTHELTSLLSYQPTNFSSTFQSDVSHELTVTRSTLQLAIEGPGEVVAGEEFAFSVTLENRSTVTLTDLRLRGLFPSSFAFTGSDIEPRPGEEYVWSFDQLAPNEPTTIVFRGRFSGNVGDLREVGIEAGLATDDSTFRPQMRKSHVVLLTQPQLDVAVTVNTAASPLTASLGDVLDVRVNLNNTSDLLMEDVTVRVTLDATPGAVLDETTFTNDQGGTLFGDVATWTPETTPDLTEIQPGVARELVFRIALLDQLRITESEDREYHVTLTAKVTPERIRDLPTVTYEQLSEPFLVRITTKTGLTSEARYFTEEHTQVGSGPHPPVVGETTTYRITWMLTTTTNDLSDVRLVATLPAGATWGGSRDVTAGTMEYVAAKRLVKWTINQAPAHSGTLEPSLTASFTVAVTPTDAQLGMLVPLLDDAQLTARDRYAKTDVELTAPAVTTELANDPDADGDGRVRSE